MQTKDAGQVPADEIQDSAQADRTLAHDRDAGVQVTVPAPERVGVLAELVETGHHHHD